MIQIFNMILVGIVVYQGLHETYLLHRMAESGVYIDNDKKHNNQHIAIMLKGIIFSVMFLFINEWACFIYTIGTLVFTYEHIVSERINEYGKHHNFITKKI